MSSGNWSDLTARTLSAALMALVGLWAIWSGGAIFQVVVAVVCGLMTWELTGMLRPNAPSVSLGFGCLGGGVVLVAAYMPLLLAIVLLAAPAVLGYLRLARYQRIFASFTFMILLAGLGMMLVRDNLGFGWMIWLVAVVVVTDVFGYFAGRLVGGPKFWPQISPKKTWSGTCAGWVGAALVGWIFSYNTGLAGPLIVVSVLMSFASQMGDIAESAIKRKMGVKDSSALIPGHGGLLDRFDGMLGASLFVLCVGILFGFPPVWS